MGLFSKKPGMMDEIRCDEPSYLIWKWHPAGTRAGESSRENAIRNGSSLRVKSGEVAVIVCDQFGDGNEDYIEGPCDVIVNTQNFPVLAKLVGLGYKGGTPFPAEVYFINMANDIQVKFAAPYFDVFDNAQPNISVPVAVRGTIDFCIDDYKSFVKLHRLRTFTPDDFQAEMRDTVVRSTKDAVLKELAASSFPLIQIEGRGAHIAEALEQEMREKLATKFGISVTSIDIGTIDIDKSSEGYNQILAARKA